MLQPRIKQTKYGVIIGRFQVPELHDGHKSLIDSAIERHGNNVMVMIGITPDVLVTRNNPLDFQTRMLMIKEAYPDVIISPIKDVHDDGVWSKNVDYKIDETFTGVSDGREVTIYGSRDGFIPHYKGKYPTVELAPTINVSGTKVREMASKEVRLSADFRRGVIYASHQRHPTAFSCADVACIKYKTIGKKNGILVPDKVAMVWKKTDEPGVWRFPGGFFSPTEDGRESVARRELMEETGLSAEDFQYVGDYKVDDFRYRNEPDQVFTSLFACTYQFGRLEATDDVDDAEWISFDDLSQDGAVENMILAEHQPLMLGLLQHLRRVNVLTDKGA